MGSLNGAAEECRRCRRCRCHLSRLCPCRPWGKGKRKPSRSGAAEEGKRKPSRSGDELAVRFGAPQQMDCQSRTSRMFAGFGGTLVECVVSSATKHIRVPISAVV